MSADRRLAIQRYAHERLRRETRAYGAQAALARRLRVSTAHVANILNHPTTHRIGDDMIHKLAEHWGLDYAGLEREAMAAMPRNMLPARTVELDDRYPSRAMARTVALSAGVHDAAIAEVDGIALDADDDPGVFFWIDQYRAAAARLAPRTPARADAGADTAASVARTRPRLPRR